MKIRLVSASIAILTLLSIRAFAETPPVRLLCEFKSPIGLEAQQQYLLEIALDSRAVRSTQFVDGIVRAVTTYDISTANEQSVLASRKDDTGRLQQGITINRFTAEAQFHWFFYGAARDNLWNSELKQTGGFKDDPVQMNSNSLQCRNAVQQF
jgi:hypothetical protein